ncbi:hypothetical protein AC579_8401 [Pseudocercospora musae]|uniref:D-xylose 1-dehydrogenase (NADP(+), D-xylono-1,5-lactone-forming) n=1 Tax=Pseudocercospora musae TaxID=113226 RepID=A0A139I387_9PEZI|nr:hypothetical protein AC579_8401 [Pseudocercospora musae]
MSKRHIILVHGAYHRAWHLQPLKAELEQNGYGNAVSTLDSPATGPDPENLPVKNNNSSSSRRASNECDRQWDNIEMLSASPVTQPTALGSYQEVYDRPEVECIHIGTAHSFHKQNCLDAIKAGKHALCEYPFAMNAKEASEVFQAARQKSVFVVEAMRTRCCPLVMKVRDVIFVEKKLGTAHRDYLST